MTNKEKSFQLIKQNLNKIRILNKEPSHLSFKYALLLLELRNQGMLTYIYRTFNTTQSVIHTLEYLQLVKVISNEEIKPYINKLTCELTPLGHIYVNWAFDKYPTYKIFTLKKTHQHLEAHQKDQHLTNIMKYTGLAIANVLAMGISILTQGWDAIPFILILPLIDILTIFGMDTMTVHSFIDQYGIKIPNPHHPNSIGDSFIGNPQAVPIDFPEQGMIIYCFSNQLHILRPRNVSVNDVENLLAMKRDKSAIKANYLWNLVQANKGHVNEYDLYYFLNKHQIKINNDLKKDEIHKYMFSSSKVAQE